MTAKLEDLQRQFPEAAVTELFTRAYERGREYYQQRCKETKAA